MLPAQRRRLLPAEWSLLPVAFAAAGLLLLLAPPAAMGDAVQVGQVEAELVAELSQVVPGQPFTAGLRLRMEDQWHVYWRNPGDAGLPPKLTWNLPPGFSVGEIQWPHPDKFDVPPLMSYGYHGEVLLPVTITPPDNLRPDELVTLKATAEWLVCKEECIPGKADLSLTLPVGSGTAPVNDEWAPLFATAREKVPLPTGDWQVTGAADESSIIIDMIAPDWLTVTLSEITFIPFDKLIIENAADQQLTRTLDGYRLTVERSHYAEGIPDTLRGILVTESGWRGEGSEKALTFEVAVDGAPSTTTAATTADSNAGDFSRAILFAFLDRKSVV